MQHDQNNQKEFDFSLVLGGPLYQLYRRTRLVRPALELLKRRIIVICLLAWLPLLALTLIEGTALGGIRVPFLFDLDTHIRFLLSLALLIAAELVVHQRIRIVVAQFIERDIITPENRKKFDAIIDSSMRLRNSVTAEVLLLILIFTLGHWIWTQFVALHVATWYATPLSNNQVQFTLAGFWYAFVSVPIYQFILLRWYFRLFVWYRFLWQVSRLPLNLNALHPDHNAGLGFLSQSVYAFTPVLLAHTILLSGLIANRIWHANATLPDFKFEIAAMLILLCALIILPLSFFIVRILNAKLDGLRGYGAVASQYVDHFYLKWIGTPHYEKKSLIGSPDIQSLADLSHSFNVVRETYLIPVGWNQLIRLIIVIICPLLPLVFTMIPLEQIIERLVKTLL